VDRIMTSVADKSERVPQSAAAPWPFPPVGDQFTGTWWISLGAGSIQKGVV
jgi:hypothetical protein